MHCVRVRVHCVRVRVRVHCVRVRVHCVRVRVHCVTHHGFILRLHVPEHADVRYKKVHLEG